MALWDPSQLGAAFAAGYRAMDTNSANAGAEITQSSGSVSQWNDWSGNGRHVTLATGAAQPTYSATGFAGSLPCVTFDGGDGLRFATTGGPSNSKYQAFGVLRPTSTVFYSRAFSISATGNVDYAGAGEAVIIRNSTNNEFGAYYGGIQSIVTCSDNSVLHIGTTYNGTTQTTYKDGTAGTGVGVSISAFTLDWIGVGQRSDALSSDAWVGDIAEFVLVTGDITTNDRQKMEGYLAWKWGVQGSLPGGHPYASAAPTLGDDLMAQSWF
jgi:hypothetical protein